jgi:hypothetical protein
VTYPIARAVLVPPAGRGDPWTWVVAHCPLCTGRHIHGAGDGTNPRALLGHRVAHCVERVSLNGYVLVEVVPAEHRAAAAKEGV